MKKIILLALVAAGMLALTGCALWDEYGDRAISAITEYVSDAISSNGATSAESVGK